MRISEFGLAFIAKEESFVDHVYLDQADLPTIGYGHLVCSEGELPKRSAFATTEAWRAARLALGRKKFPGVISHVNALALFRRDLAGFEDGVARFITYPATQRQFDMLVSLAFNIGNGALERSRLRVALNAGNIGTATKDEKGFVRYTGAMDEWAGFCCARINGTMQIVAGLVRRRAREIAVFLDEAERRTGNHPNAPDMRDPTLSEWRFGKDDDDDDGVA